MTAPTATPSLLSTPTPALPASANVWGTGLDFPHPAPTLPTACAALIAFVIALLFVAVFLGVGWRMGSRAVLRDEEAASLEGGSLGGVTVVEDVEVFSYVFSAFRVWGMRLIFWLLQI